MNVQEKPTEANFKLKSIKSIKRGKLTVNAYKIVDSKEIPQSGEYPATPHPDLFQALDDLLPYVVNHFGINNYIKLAESKEFGAMMLNCQDIQKLLFFVLADYSSRITVGSPTELGAKWQRQSNSIFSHRIRKFAGVAM